MVEKRFKMIFDAKSFWFGFVLGMTILGIIVVMESDPCPKQEQKINYSELEQKVDKATCEALLVNAIITERIRLTGRPNP